MDPLVAYAADFEEIVDLAWHVHQKHHRHPNPLDCRICSIFGTRSTHRDSLQTIFSLARKHGGLSSAHHLVLFKELSRISNSYWSTFTLEREDIEQQLRYLWIKYNKMFSKKEKKRTSLRDYLLACTVMGMSTWYYREVVGVSYDTSLSLEELAENTVGSPDKLSLDFSFVIKGTTIYPLQDLTPYERYLLFLRYKTEKTTVEIAYVVQKDRKTVSRQLARIHNKLRRLADEAKDPR